MATSFATVIKADLSSLAALEPENAPDSDPNAADFLDSFSSLLASVRNGDAAGAREAATALQFELFGGPRALSAAKSTSPDAMARMLDDLHALIRGARLGDLGAAENAARALGRAMQRALLGPAPRFPQNENTRRRRGLRTVAPDEPQGFVQGATAAYETLMEGEPSNTASAA